MVGGVIDVCDKEIFFAESGYLCGHSVLMPFSENSSWYLPLEFQKDED